MRLVLRFLREPMVHFLAAGGLMFAVYFAISGPPPEPADVIVIGPERVMQLRSGFEATWRRQPNREELKALIENYTREEVYNREALALGLDRDDPVIRRRLRQKMEFLSHSGSELLTPGAGELEAYFATHREDYRREPTIAFEQVYLGERPTAATVAEALGSLDKDPAAGPSSLGVQSLLPAHLDPTIPSGVDAVFGRGFFARLQNLPNGRWAGPVTSGYGKHLVRIGTRSPGTVPSLAEIHEAVLRDWRAAKGREVREATYAKLRARYKVEIHWPDALPQVQQ